MSLSTRCPSCATTFKVVPDQLKVSEGWVRCGQCGQVFDANEHLRPLLAAEVDEDEAADAGPLAAGPPPSVAGTPGSAQADRPAPWDDAPSLGRGWSPAAEASLRPRAAERTGTHPSPEPDEHPNRPLEPLTPADQATLQRAEAGAPAVWMRRSPAARMVLHGETLERPEPRPAEVSDLPEVPDAHGRGAPRQDDDEEEAGEVPSALLLQTADNDEPQQSLYQTAFVPPAPDAGTPEAVAEALPGDAAATLRELQFVRVAERRAFWQQPVVVLASLLVCGLLMVALLLQVLRTERDSLAAHLPGLRPLLESVCRPFGCQVAPLQRADAVVIDHSAFNKVQGELFQFEVEVRNTARVPLAMPALELTLTDSQDVPLLRRVLTASDMRAAAVLEAGGAWSGSLPVQLAAPVAAERVAGYRVLAFYP